MKRYCLFSVMALATAFLCVAGLSGCDCGIGFLDPDNDDNEPPSWDDSHDPPPPSVDTIEIPEWPPLGREGEVHIHVHAEQGLEYVDVEFAREVRRYVSGYSDDVTVTGGELGEGFGTMSVTVFDTRHHWANRLTNHLLVDLSPPKVEVPWSTVRGDGWLEVWVGDAWVLGSVELQVGDVTLVHSFPEVWPGTLGDEWDESIVTFEMEELPGVTGPAELRAFDAAGNRTVENFDLVIDDEPPSVEIVEPEPDTMVLDRFVVAVKATDNVTDSPFIELRAGGSPVASVLGPYAEIVLDARDFAAGMIELTAEAADGVGNRSISDPLPIVVK